MKKTLLALGIASLMATSISAQGYFDRGFSNNKIKSHQFGFFVGGEYRDTGDSLDLLDTEEFVYSGGINTNFMYDLPYRFDIGGKLALSYMSEDSLLGGDSYKYDIYPYIGFKATDDIHVYAGYGVDGWSEIENQYIVVGVDYYFADYLIVEFNYKRNDTEGLSDLPNYESENKYLINFVIPFNFY